MFLCLCAHLNPFLFFLCVRYKPIKDSLSRGWFFAVGLHTVEKLILLTRTNNRMLAFKFKVIFFGFSFFPLLIIWLSF